MSIKINPEFRLGDVVAKCLAMSLIMFFIVLFVSSLVLFLGHFSSRVNSLVPMIAFLCWQPLGSPLWPVHPFIVNSENFVFWLIRAVLNLVFYGVFAAVAFFIALFVMELVNLENWMFYLMEK